jgi:hypothetical protein
MRPSGRVVLGRDIWIYRKVFRRNCHDLLASGFGFIIFGACDVYEKLLRVFEGLQARAIESVRRDEIVHCSTRYVDANVCTRLVGAPEADFIGHGLANDVISTGKRHFESPVALSGGLDGGFAVSEQGASG